MRKPLKWAGIILSVILVILILLLVLIHTTTAKNFIRGKLEAYLISKTNTQLHITAINYRLPKWVELDGIFIGDRSGDTLLSGDKVRVDINMMALLKGKYMISKIILDNVAVNISRKANDSNFNYQFLIDAFASKSPQPQKKSAVVISLDEVEIAHSAIRWHDSYGGTIMDTKIGSFHATIDSLDIFSQKYAFHKATIADMVFDLQLLNLPYKTPLVVTQSSQTELLPVIKIGQAEITRSHIGFDGQNTGFHTVNDINEMKLAGFSMVSAEQVSIEQLTLLNSSLLLNRKDVKSISKNKLQKDTTVSHVNYRVQHALLLNNNIAFNDLSVKRKGNGLDANHMQLSSLSGGMGGFVYAGSDLSMHIDSLSAREQNGFRLDSLHGDFAVNDTLITAKNILIKTPLSRISGNTIVYLQSINDTYRGNLQNRFVFTNTVIAKKDLVFLAPAVIEKYKKQLSGVSFIYLTTDITGNAKLLDIKTLSVHSDKNDIYVNANGMLYNAFSSNGLQYDLFISKAVASKSFIEPFVNTNGKQKINLPPSISITGKLKGDLKQVTSDMVITSSYGMASFKGHVKNFTKPDQLAYNMRIVAKELETGKWVNQDSTWGKLNGNIQVKGSGIDYKKANIESLLDLSSFRIKQHNYIGIQFNLNGVLGAYDIKGSIADSLLRLNLQMKTDLNGQYPTATGKVNIKNADLFALGLSADSFRFKSMMDIRGTDLSPENLNAFVRLDSTVLYKNGQQLFVDSFIVKGKIDSGKTFLTIQSPFADAFVKGNTNTQRYRIFINTIF